MRTGAWNDDAAPDADWWDAAARWTGHDAMWLKGLHLFGAVPSAGGKVLGGLACSAGSGASTDITAGAAIHYNASIYTETVDSTETVSPFGQQLLIADGNVTHDDNTSGSTRVDLVTIASTISTDRSLNVQQKSPNPLTAQNTRWGAVTTVQVIKGTPGAGAPALTTGHTLIASVSIPTGTTGANWSASVTYTDEREPILPLGGATVTQQAFSWMGAAGSYDEISGTKGSDFGLEPRNNGHHLRCYWIANTPEFHAFLPIPVEPGWRITAARVSYIVVTALDGTSPTVDVTLYKVNEDESTATTIATATLSNSAASHEDDLSVTETEVGAGEFVYAKIDWDQNNGGSPSQGEIDMRTIQITRERVL